MRAIVVGAGIGGLTTALGLRDAGWDVTVLERWPEVVGIGAALGIWPAAADGLAAVGLGEQFTRHSVAVPGAAVYRRDGRVLLRVPDGSPRIPPVRLISRRRLMALLVTAAEGIVIRTGFPADATVLRSALADTDVLIGADGLRSDVRTTFFAARTAPRYSGLIGVRGYVDFASGEYGETWGDGSIFGNTPMEGGRTNFYAAFPAAADEPSTLHDVRARFAGWREPIPKILAAAGEEDVRTNPIYDLHPPLRSFVGDRVVLLGDAAHAMTPHAGRGACEAIVDATTLVRHLGAAPDVPAALRAYDGERRRAAQRIAARSWRIRAVAHATTFAPLRNGLVRAAGRFVR